MKSSMQPAMKPIMALAAITLALACLTGAVIADAPARLPDLALTTETPVVDVPTHPPGRQFLELPALEYAFGIEARCDADWVPESLSLNVADSRVVLGEDQLSGAEPPTVLLEVPARQLAPIAVHGFCLLGEDLDEGLNAGPDAGPDTPRPAASASQLTIRAVLSAQASLLCRNEAERRIAYVSLPLDVQLACKSRPAAANGL